MDDSRLPPELEATLYRVVQEALTNIARHAEASWARVVLKRRVDRAIAIVEDNGVGFDLEAAEQSGRLGLLGMRERAELLGGRLILESAPGPRRQGVRRDPCLSGAAGRLAVESLDAILAGYSHRMR